MSALALALAESEVTPDSSEDSSHRSLGAAAASFIPPFLLQSWAQATTPDEVSACLEEVSLAFQSFDASEKARFSDDAAFIVSQTLPSLASESASVLIHALSLLLHVAEFHASVFMGSLAPLFMRLERFLSDSRSAIRNNAVRLISTLVVRVPCHVMGPYLTQFLEDPDIKPSLAMKFMCLSLLYSRTNAARSQAQIDTLVEYLLNWTKAYLTKHSIELDIPIKNKGDDTIAALFDLICIITRIYLVDPFEQAVVRVDDRVHSYASIIARTNSDITTLLRELPVSDAAQPHIATRSVQLEFSTLVHDVDMAASYWYVLSIPLPKREQHSLAVPHQLQHLSPPASMQSHIESKLSKSPAQTDSTMTKTVDPNISVQQPRQAPSLSSQLGTEFSGLRVTIPDDLPSTGHMSPSASPLRKSPSRRPSGKLEHIPLPIDKTIFEHEVSPDQDLPSSGRRPSLAHLPEQAAEEAKVALSFANPGSPLHLHRDKSSSNLPRVQSSGGGLLSSIPYQPPPSSWGHTLGDSEAGMHDSSPSRSATTTSGVTTSSSSSTTTASSVPPIESLASGDEDWQRVSTATPWMYLPTSAAASPYGDSMRSGLMSPARFDEPVDRSKLSSLKRPGRNFRSSGSSGTSRRHQAHKDESDKRAFSADASIGGIDGLVVTNWSAPMTPGSVGDDDSARWTGGRPSESAGYTLNQIVEGAHDELGSMDAAAESYAPISTISLDSSLPDIASPVHVRKPEHIHSHLNKGSKRDLRDEKPNLVATGVSALHSHHHHHRDSDGAVELGRTSASVATIFDDGNHGILGERTSFKSNFSDGNHALLGERTSFKSNHLDVTRSLDVPLASVQGENQLHIDMAEMHTSFDSSELYSESQSIDSMVAKKKRIPISPRSKNVVVAATRKSAISALNAEDAKSPDASARFPKIKGEKGKPPAIDTRAVEASESETISHNKMSENYDYISSEELTRLQNPSQELQLVVEGLHKDDWPQIFYTLNKLRQLVLHHKEFVLNGEYLHQIVVGVTKQVNNLRSVVCKNTLLAISDMFLGLGKAMDVEASGLIPLIFKRSADSSTFIIESANTALVSMLSSVSTGRMISCLVQFGLDHKTATIRGVAAALVSELIDLKAAELKTGSTCREQFDVLKVKLPKLLSDSSPAVRAHARETLRRLLHRDIMTRSQLEALVTVSALEKALMETTNPIGPLPLAKPMASTASSQDGGLTDTENDHVGDMLRAVSKRAANATISSPSVRSGIPSPSTSGARKAKAIVPSGSSKNKGEDASRSEAPIELGVSGRASGAQPSEASVDGARYSALQAAQARKELESIPELLLLPDIQQRLQSKNWLERNNALTQLSQIIVDHTDLLQKSGRLDRLVENILDRLEDGSVKVVLHALQCLARIHDERPTVFASMFSVAVPVFLNAMSASNKQIAVMASSIYSRFADTIQPYSSLLQLLTTIAAHEKDRMRCAAFGALSGFMASHWKQPGSYIGGADLSLSQRVLFPMICQTVCASATKPEVRSAACDTLRQLQACVEEPLWKWTTNNQQQTDIKRYIA